jgi:chromosome segregation ATPase
LAPLESSQEHKKQTSSLWQRLDGLAQQEKVLEIQLLDKNEEILALQSSYESLQRKNESLANRCETASGISPAEKDLLVQQLSELQSQKEILQSKDAALRRRILTLEQSLRVSENLLGQQKKECAELHESFQSKDSEIDELRAQCAQTGGIVEALSERLAESKRRVCEMQQEIMQKEALREDAEAQNFHFFDQKIQTLKKELDELKEQHAQQLVLRDAAYHELKKHHAQDCASWNAEYQKNIKKMYCLTTGVCSIFASACGIIWLLRKTRVAPKLLLATTCVAVAGTVFFWLKSIKYKKSTERI